MQEALEKLCAPLRESWTLAVGIAPEERVLHLVCLERAAASWRLAETLQLPLPQAAEEASFWQEAAGAVKLALAKRGWEKARIAVSLPEEQVFFYRKEFPPLSDKELKEAVRWDLLASLPAAEAEDAYSMDFQRLDGREVLLAALPRGKAQEIHRAFDEAGLCFASLTFLPTAVLPTEAAADEWQEEAVTDAVQEDAAAFAADGMSFARGIAPEDRESRALWAAQGLLASSAKQIELLPQTMRPSTWARGRLLAVFAAVCFLCMTAVYAWNAWQLHVLQEEEQAIAQEMLLLSAERQRMELASQEAGRAAAKERQLASLSKGALPCRSLLVHFGTRTVEGAWIRGLRVVDGHAVELEGAATSYDALANFVRALEEDKAFFTASPLLKKSERRQEGAGRALIYFWLELKI